VIDIHTVNPAGGGIDVGELAGELEQIRKRGVRWLDGDGRQERLDSFPQVEKLAAEFTARQGRDALARWQTIELLLRAAVERPEAAPARERLVKLYGLDSEVGGTSSVDLAYHLRTSERISAKTFQRRNSTSRHCLAEAVNGLFEQLPDIPETTGPQPVVAATKVNLVGALGLILLSLSTGTGAALAIGLANDPSYLVGLFVLLAGWLAGFRVPLPVILPIAIVLTVVLLTNVIGEFWPIAPWNGLMGGFLAAIPFGYALKHIVRLIRRLKGNEFIDHWFVAILTSVFWLGLGATLLFGAGSWGPRNSLICTGFVAAFAVSGFLAFRRAVNGR